MLHVHVECGRHPTALRRWFPAPEPDPFFEEDVLASLYGDAWTSIVIEEDGHALRHAFAASAIGTTGLFDIEPLVGYAGLLSTPDAAGGNSDRGAGTLQALCRDNGIVGELVRFNPLLQNHRALDGLSANLVLPASKPVVYLSVQEDEAAVMSSYPPETRNMVRAGYRSSSISTLEKPQRHGGGCGSSTRAPWRPMIRGRNGRWPPISGSGCDSSALRVFRRRAPEQLVSGAIALVHGRTWYYFLAAGVRDPEARRGAGNALVHEIARTAAAAGARKSGLAAAGRHRRRFVVHVQEQLRGRRPAVFVGLFTPIVRSSRAHRIDRTEQPSVSASPLFLRFRLASIFFEGACGTVSMPSFARQTSVAEDREHFILWNNRLARGDRAGRLSAVVRTMSTRDIVLPSSRTSCPGNTGSAIRSRSTAEPPRSIWHWCSPA